MSRKLRVFFTVRSMSAEIANKGNLSGAKEYTKQHMQRDFDETVTPDDAKQTLENEFGPCPQGQPHGAHSFVRIDCWNYVHG